MFDRSPFSRQYSPWSSHTRKAAQKNTDCRQHLTDDWLMPHLPAIVRMSAWDG